MKEVSLLLVVSAILAANSPIYAADSAEPCINRVLARDLPYDIYAGVANDRRTFLQPRNGHFGLSKDAAAIIENMASATAIPLCDTNIALVWRPETFGKFPEYLIGRVYQKNLTSQTEEFRITESDETQWEYDVAPLLSGAFVVTWKSDTATMDQAGRPGVKIRARIIGSNGVPIGKSFTVSTSPGNHGQATVVGLPDGGFAFAWRLFGTGVFLRIYGKDGAPRTDQILVAKEDEPSRGYVPYAYVTRAGQINLFLKYFYDLDEKTPFRVARSYHSNGEAVTNILTADAITQIVGYQESVERLVRQDAHQLEYRMREHIQKDVMGFRFCDFGMADVSRAAKLKVFTRNGDMKGFFTAFCQEHQRSCRPPGYPNRKQELEQCAQAD